MPVKHWTFAGLLLTYWCNARCASCYVCGGPESDLDMSVARGLALWEGLASASPHGCRIHVGGGEPFGRWETLIELVRRARHARLGPLQAVETNAFWAGSQPLVRDRLRALDEAGMQRLTVSCDPYHQQFVPLAAVRLLARTAEEVLGPQRVRVRWRDWLEGGFDTADLPADRQREVFLDFARRGRDRLTGRAADELADGLPLMPPSGFADSPCNGALMRSRHVHADGAGNLCPGTCAGIVLARVEAPGDVGTARERLSREGPAGIVGVLAARGPVGLLQIARGLGCRERPGGYASKCHLCWSVRKWLFQRGHFHQWLGPANLYGF